MDESGAAWEATDTFVLGGLLIPNRATRAYRVALERRIRLCAAGVAWPPHANRLGIPAARVEAVLRGASGCSELAQSLAEVVDGVDHADVVRWRTSLQGRGGGESDRACLIALDGWLRTHHHWEWRRLGAESRLAEQRLLAVPRSIRGAIGIANVDLPGTQLREPREPRYLRVLTGLFHRLALLLDEGDDVVVHLAAFDDSFDSQRLHACLSDLPEPLRRRITTVIPRPQRYREGVHAGLVVADVVVNRIRRSLRGTWNQVSDRVREVVGLPVDRMERPAIGVEGVPRVALDAVMSGRRPPSRDPRLLPAWAIGQAEMWMRQLGFRP